MRLNHQFFYAAVMFVSFLGMLFVGSLFIGSYSVSAQQANTCNKAEYKEFDFWLGKWKVETPDGKLAGYNVITRHLNNCVIKESYHTPGGFKGESFNTYNAASKQWHQTWVDNTGTLLLLDGGLEGNAMVLSGGGKNANGQDIIHRITWRPSTDGSVRQLWEFKKANSNESDKNAWQILFDGKYTKM